MIKEFSLTFKITKNNKLNIGKKNIIDKIIEQTPLGHLNWRISESIFNASENVKIAFLRGYFDGDGTASGQVRMFSTNKKGLKQVSKLLTDLSFKHTFQGPYFKKNRKPSYILQISRKDRERFLNTLNPISKRPVCGGSR